MASTTFNGPVRSEKGFQVATKNTSTGAITTRMSSGMPDLTGLSIADVATGSSFKAKTGETDDLVSALLLVIRIMNVLRDWDPRIYNTFKSMDTQEDYTPPMPIFVSTNY